MLAMLFDALLHHRQSLLRSLRNGLALGLGYDRHHSDCEIVGVGDVRSAKLNPAVSQRQKKSRIAG